MNSLCPAPLPFPGPRILCGPLPLPPPPVQESPRLPFLFLGKGQVASQGEGPCVASHFPKARSSASMGFPEPQSGWQRVCSSGRLALALLGFIGLISLLTVVFGITETDDLKKLAKFNKAVEHLTDEMGKVKSEVQGKVGNLRNTLNTMNCNVEDIKHNRTVSRAPCCPAGWDSFASHCYWVSRAEKSWDEAKADCEDKDAHLVTITSYLEQQFVAKRTKPRYAWIGLSFSSSSWKWVDGTSYSVRRIDWKTGHPYHFFQGVNNVVICVHLHRDGLWNEDPCMHRYSWVCEMELKG
ncbi:asialoglycoprotein receptor 1-like isoform X3 [Sphaerodactylus townsendi]|uniref:asialoglycoprotein receptor 1-like isoform X3 n=1 Tax=Sphaerodactylus townsendi TaxID=933632 RepID=UPI0020275EBB|nr:asialoglycoprotein receptor 1-like isoform X3 [Sphaerodactylus townsendi]